VRGLVLGCCEVRISLCKREARFSLFFSHTSLAKRDAACLHKKKSIEAKTYNSGDSLVVTHLTTSPPVSCLNRAERTGSLVLKILWSYVKDWAAIGIYIPIPCPRLILEPMKLQHVRRRPRSCQQ
jgi:hypothetical protein